MAEKAKKNTIDAYKEIETKIRNREFSQVYFFYGEEPFFIDRLSKLLEETILTPEEREFNQISLFGKDTSPDVVVANAKQFPFGSPYRVVILKEAKEMKDLDLLNTYIENPSPHAILVICCKYATLKSTKLKIKSGGNCQTFNSEKIADWNIPQWIASTAKSDFEYVVSPQVSAMLSENIGNDLSRIYTELTKLSIVLPRGSEITPDIVEKHIGISKEYNIFELQEALGTRNLEKTYKIMLNFSTHQKENPNVLTISMLFSFFQKLLNYHLLPDKSEKSAIEELFGKSSFVANKNISYAQNYSLSQLIRIISIIREYDAKSKGIGQKIDDSELVKELILKITK